MKLFAGLGNPGDRYAGTRHNIGFMAVDRIAADHGFAPWRSKFQGHVAEGRLGREKVLLLKPGTFMNLSGQAVGEAMRFHKIDLADLVVFHDEIDLAPGRLKWKQGGGHAGHNGLRSLHGHVGEGYGRVRMGVGHPGHKDAVAGYVLRDFAKSDADWLDAMLRGVSDGAAALAEGDPPRFLNAVALRLTPPRSGGQAASGPRTPKGAQTGRAGSRRDGTSPAGVPPVDRAPAGAPGTSPSPAAEEPSAGPSAASASRPVAAGTDTEAPAQQDTRSPLQRLVDRFR